METNNTFLKHTKSYRRTELHLLDLNGCEIRDGLWLVPSDRDLHEFYLCEINENGGWTITESYIPYSRYCNELEDAYASTERN